MEAFITPVLIVSIVAILFVVVFSSRRSRKLDSGDPAGLFKPKDAVRLIQVVLLLVFCAAAYLTARHNVAPLTGFIAMAILFIAWVPFQFWFNARLRTDDDGIVLSSVWGRVTELRWQNVRSIRLISGNVILQTGNGEFRIPGYFTEQVRLLEIIRQHIPNEDG